MEEIQTFGWALRNLKDGKRVQRIGWNGKGMWLQLIDADQWKTVAAGCSDYPLCGFIAMKTADGKLVPWLASQTDVLAEDWQLA